MQLSFPNQTWVRALPGPRLPRGLGLLLWFALQLVSGAAFAEGVRELEVGSPPGLGAYLGKPLSGVRVESVGALWQEDISLSSVRPGDLFRPELVRRGLRELEATGRFAEVRGMLETGGPGLVLVYEVRPRRLVAQVRLEQTDLESGPLLRALGLGPDDEITDRGLAEAAGRVRGECRMQGYPAAQVRIAADETDDPLRMLVRVDIELGLPERIRQLEYRVAPSPHHPALGDYLSRFEMRRGDLMDQARIEEAVRGLVERLVAGGFLEASASFDVPRPGLLRVDVVSGPKYSLRIEGAEHFSSEELSTRLELEESPEFRPEVLSARLQDTYVKAGFLDAEVTFKRLLSSDGLVAELYGWVREGRRFAVSRRIFPCLRGSFSEAALNEEVDGVLREHFPSFSLVDPPNGEALDTALGTATKTGRPTPLRPAPYDSYSEEAYLAVRRHLEDLYRSEAYLSARAGPITLARRRCSALSGPDECIPLGPPPLPSVECARIPENTEVVETTCVADRKKGIACEAAGVAVVPVFPGQQAVLYDVSLDGNRRFTAQQLLRVAKFPVGKPARPRDIDAGLQRIADHYADEAYAFAVVDSDLEVSPDGTRARLTVSINEREKVRVARIDVRGAERTREGLIRSRLALAPGDYYRRRRVTRSQAQVETLGVFSSVAIALEDPGIPAKEKVMVVTVSERLPQFVDIKGGFATADGFRIGFEYGHRNLGGEAIQLLIRSQLGFRPVFLIPEDDVRRKYEALAQGRGALADLLERRNTITVAFPDIGLGPLFRFEAELLDVRDNNRDFGQTKEAVVLQLTHRPRRQWLFTLGATLEYNDAEIFGTTVDDDDPDNQKNQLEEFVRANPNLGSTIRVPEGKTIAWTQYLRASWDRRDQQLSAHRGTYVGWGVEHVSALPLRDADEGGGTSCTTTSGSVFAASCSEFLRHTGRVAGYIPLSDRGWTLALSLRGGIITHLNRDSRTYPDRLFFVGGGDTIRGYPQDSLVPQDLVDQLESNPDFTIDQVVLRGGDVFINPRAELRIPLGGSLATAIFLDAGNLWADPSNANFTQLRYALGTGIRVGTPVGPLVFDYGFNLERLLEELGVSSGQARSWEDIGAFHFSIGLF